MCMCVCVCICVCVCVCVCMCVCVCEALSLLSCVNIGLSSSDVTLLQKSSVGICHTILRKWITLFLMGDDKGPCLA